MSHFAEKTISSWTDFTALVPMDPSAPSLKKAWIYRGQSDDKTLATTIERALNKWRIGLHMATFIEFQTIREFRRRLRDPLHHTAQSDTLFCLAHMQHYGAPTRLLDCTFSPFVAAAFAMQDGGTVGNPVVWCLKAQWCEDEAKK